MFDDISPQRLKHIMILETLLSVGDHDHWISINTLWKYIAIIYSLIHIQKIVYDN